MEFTDSNFEDEVLKSDIPVFVDFWASWCLPCKVSDPIVEKLEKEYEGRVKVGKLNVDRNPITAGKFSVSGVPTYVTIRDGGEVERLVAAQAEASLRQMIERVLG